MKSNGCLSFSSKLGMHFSDILRHLVRIEETQLLMQQAEVLLEVCQTRNLVLDPTGVPGCLRNQAGILPPSSLSFGADFLLPQNQGGFALRLSAVGALAGRRG